MRATLSMTATWKFRSFALLAIITFHLFSCASKNESEDIVISGDLLSPHSLIEGKNVFLGDNRTHKFLDSTVVREGKFRLRIKPGVNFIPFKCSILFATGNPIAPHQVMGYKNPYFEKTYESTLYADRGNMYLNRDTSSKMARPDVFEFSIDEPNKQTQAAFRHLSFKVSDQPSAENRKYNVELVKKYSYSVDLLSQLTWAKQKMADDELSELLALFEEKLHQSPVVEEVNRHLAYKNATGTTFPADLELTKPDGSLTSNVLKSDADYNLVVFWASWCAPCRHEIPDIKSLHQKHGKKLHITSISIDKKDDAWKKALAQENMPWKQFLAGDEHSLTVLDKKYDLSAIPVWVLFDSKSNLVDKQIGFYTGEEGILRKVETHLSKF